MGRIRGESVISGGLRRFWKFFWVSSDGFWVSRIVRRKGVLVLGWVGGIALHSDFETYLMPLFLRLHRRLQRPGVRKGILEATAIEFAVHVRFADSHVLVACMEMCFGLSKICSY